MARKAPSSSRCRRTAPPRTRGCAPAISSSRSAARRWRTPRTCRSSSPARERMATAMCSSGSSARAVAASSPSRSKPAEVAGGRGRPARIGQHCLDGPSPGGRGILRARRRRNDRRRAPVLSVPRPQPQREMSPVRLTILMPCLDEARTLAACIKKAQSYLAHAGISGEIIVADNGSTDGSREIAHALGARVVTVAAKGYGNALRAGIEAARGVYIIMGDADDSYDFLELGAFLRRLDDGRALVIRNPLAGGIKPGAMPALHRYLGNPVLSFLGRRLFDRPVHDLYCGLRELGADAIRAPAPNAR